MIDTIEFKVGDKFENMKGPYEVISVDGDSMVIRWETGEEVSTEIELQQRILQRLDLEKRLKERARQKKSSAPRKARAASARYGNKFNGMEDGDFKKNITGTNWRSRTCLGGAVTEKLPSDKFSFNPWPVIHWAGVSLRERGNTWQQAKFLAEVDDERLCYGLYLEYHENGADDRHDYGAFTAWLKDPKNEGWLCRTAAENDLAIYDLEEKGFKGVIKAHQDKWRIELPGGPEKIDSLSAFLDGLPDERGLDLNIARIEEKAAVLAREAAISEDISGVFQALMPVYDAASPDIS